MHRKNDQLLYRIMIGNPGLNVPERTGIGLKATIVITSNSNRQFLEPSLVSYEIQTTDEPFEVIVVRYGTEETGSEFLTSYNSPYPFKFLINKTFNRIAARNLGISMAHGEVLIFCEDYVIVPPDFISNHIKYQAFYKGALLTSYYADTANIDPQLIPLDPNWVRQHWDEVEKHAAFSSKKRSRKQKAWDRFKREFIAPWVFCKASNVSIPAEHIQQYGGFDETFHQFGGEDLEWGYRLWRSGMPVYCLKELIAYRQSDSGKDDDERKKNRFISILKKHPDLEIGLLELVEVSKEFSWNNYQRCIMEYRKATKKLRCNHLVQLFEGLAKDYIVNLSSSEQLSFRSGFALEKEFLEQAMEEQKRLILKGKYPAFRRGLNRLCAKFGIDLNDKSKITFGEMEFTEPPSVSIVIPTFNAMKEYHFEALLRMLQNQKGFKAVEIVIVDSGSTDGTTDRVKDYSLKLIEIPQESFSHSYARNLGAEHTSHDYILFTTQDTLPPTETWLYDLYAFLKDNDIAALSCMEFPREDADLFYRVCSWNHYHNVFGLNGNFGYSITLRPKVINYDNLRKRANISDICCLMVKNVFMKYKYRYDYAEDLDLGIRLLLDDYKLALLGSSKIIHSHNREAYYFLKRGYMDTIYLSKLFSDFPVSAIEMESQIKDIFFTYSVLQSLVHHCLPQIKTPCDVKTFIEMVKAQLNEAYGRCYPSFNELGDEIYMDEKLKVFLTKVHQRYPLKNNGLYNDSFFEAMKHFLNATFDYLTNTYEFLDDFVFEDIKCCVFKEFALLIGVRIANCYLISSDDAKESLIDINAELMGGI